MPRLPGAPPWLTELLSHPLSVSTFILCGLFLILYSLCARVLLHHHFLHGLWGSGLWICDCSHLRRLRNSCYSSTDIVLPLPVIASVTVAITPYYCSVLVYYCCGWSYLPLHCLFADVSTPALLFSHIPIPTSYPTLFSGYGGWPRILYWEPGSAQGFCLLTRQVSLTTVTSGNIGNKSMVRTCSLSKFALSLLYDMMLCK